MSYMLPNRPSISYAPGLCSRLNNLEVDGIAIVGTSNGHVYHFRVFIYNHALGCSLSLDCNPTYDAGDPDKACVTVAFKSYAWTTSQNAPPGRIPPSTGPFEVKLKTSTKAWKICSVLFDSLNRDHYQHWCATILGDLEAHGYVSSGASAQFETWERVKCRELGIGIFILPRVQGVFYS
ncbi:hypothetical protein EV421DRAFT_1739164 [Armillaria borealis]|uniref:DUF7770 domain-containing protein n=1 Tax=Armillaria borealis TaxID=47425 RepID=A0AA39MKM5_9AGAR|nr:hypothetical protein EV421DRAFT_1739164 [Armillaria borealis]